MKYYLNFILPIRNFDFDISIQIFQIKQMNYINNNDIIYKQKIYKKYIKK